MTGNTEYSLSVTEAMLVNEDGSLHGWHDVYWEIRNSGMGYQVCDAFRVNDLAPWIMQMEPVHNVRQLPSEVPQGIRDRMIERKLLAA